MAVEGRAEANFRSSVEVGPGVDPESHVHKETKCSSPRFRRKEEASMRQRPHWRVGRPRRYEDKTDFETQFHPKERRRGRKETEAENSVAKSTFVDGAVTEDQDAARQYQEHQTDRIDVRFIR